MTSKYLTREDTPVSAETWKLLDDTMIMVARSLLVGRKLVHIDGPYGLGLKGIPLADPPVRDGTLTTGFIPLTYIHRTFTLSKRDLAAYERDRLPLDLDELVNATILCTKAEENLIFGGTPSVPGLLSVKGSRIDLTAWDEVGAAAEDVIRGVDALDQAGFSGPYALALSPARFNRLLRLYPAGYASELDHMKTITTEGVFKTPGVEGPAGVLIASGKQFVSVVLGQDLAISFVGSVDERLEFSISESLALLVREPKAVCVLG